MLVSSLSSGARRMRRKICRGPPLEGACAPGSWRSEGSVTLCDPREGKDPGACARQSVAVRCPHTCRVCARSILGACRGLSRHRPMQEVSQGPAEDARSPHPRDRAHVGGECCACVHACCACIHRPQVLRCPGHAVLRQHIGRGRHAARNNSRVRKAWRGLWKTAGLSPAACSTSRHKVTQRWSSRMADNQLRQPHRIHGVRSDPGAGSAPPFRDSRPES